MSTATVRSSKSVDAQRPEDSLRLHTEEATEQSLISGELSSRLSALERMPHIFSVSAGMVGVALTGIGLVSILSHIKSIIIYGEELLSINAIVFVVCCVTAYLAMKTNRVTLHHWLCGISEVVFLIGLIMMAAICVFLAVSIN